MRRDSEKLCIHSLLQNIILNHFKMTIILDIKENSRVPFLMELLKGLKYVNIVKKIDDERKSQFITDLAEAFDDVKLYEQGKKKLKSAKDLLNEL